MRIPVLIAALGLLAVSGIAQNADFEKKPAGPPVTLHMTAKNFEFDPPEVHVRQGATIQLLVTSTDRTHGIHISPFRDGGQVYTPPGLSFIAGEDCYKLKKDVQVTIEFIALDPGTYSFKCCKLCGSGHKKMVGKIVVDPLD